MCAFASDGPGRLKQRYEYMLGYIGDSKQRSVKEVEGRMLDHFGICPRTTRKYLEWAERYGKIRFTNVNRSVVELIK